MGNESEPIFPTSWEESAMLSRVTQKQRSILSNPLYNNRKMSVINIGRFYKTNHLQKKTLNHVRKRSLYA